MRARCFKANMIVFNSCLQLKLSTPTLFSFFHSVLFWRESEKTALFLDFWRIDVSISKRRCCHPVGLTITDLGVIARSSQPSLPTASVILESPRPEPWILSQIIFDVFMHDWLKLALRFVDLLDDKDYLLWLIQLRSIALLSSFQRDFSKLAAASSRLYSPRNQQLKSNPTFFSFVHLDFHLGLSVLGVLAGNPTQNPKAQNPETPDGNPNGQMKKKLVKLGTC